MGNSINLSLPGSNQFASVSSQSATRLVRAAVNLILVAAGLVFFFLLLLGGLQYILSAGNGNQQDSQRAQRAITGAIAGLLIVFGIYTIMLLAGNFFGVNLLLFTITNV